MKLKEIKVSFTQEDVRRFVQLIGGQNAIYQCPERVQGYHFEKTPLPPTMPMIVYKWLEIPWELQTAYYSSKTEMHSTSKNVYR